jgi:hypothetical protein
MFEDCGKSIRDVEKHEGNMLPEWVSCFGSELFSKIVGKAFSDVSIHEVVYSPKYVARFVQKQLKIVAILSQGNIKAWGGFSTRACGPLRCKHGQSDCRKMLSGVLMWFEADYSPGCNGIKCKHIWRLWISFESILKAWGGSFARICESLRW